MDSHKGREDLWEWFGLSYASWLTMPRVLMHEMPDEWQEKMAALLNEWDETWKNQPDLTFHVCAKKDGKFVEMPSVLINYRHPDKVELMRFMSSKNEGD